MASTRPHSYRKQATECRANGAYVEAGDYHVAASRGYLMQYRRLPQERSETGVSAPIRPSRLGNAIRDRLSGALCYRLAGQTDRARRTCEQGIAIVEDVRDYGEYPLETEDRGPPIGLLSEMIGDFRLFAMRESYDDAYSEAEAHYEGARSPFGWQSEHEFDQLIRLLVELAQSVQYSIDEDQREQIMHFSLMDRIAFKRAHYEEIYRQVLEQGSWTESGARP